MRVAPQIEKARRGLLRTMKIGLPLLAQVPIPLRIKQEEWFRDAHLEEILEIFALPLFRLETLNGKAIPLFKTLIEEEALGKFNHRPIVVGATSGNWGASGGFLKPMFDIAGFQAVIDGKTPAGKQAHLKVSGAEVILAPEGISPIAHAHALGQQPGYLEINQYTHQGSVHGHEWTMNHIVREAERLGKDPSVFGAVAGTASTLMAAAQYLKPIYLQMKIIGVGSMSDAEKVPGSRSPNGLAEVKAIGGFRYEDAVDYPLVTNVTRAEAFSTSIELIRSLLSAGPTGGLLMAGFYHFLQEQVEKGSAHLDALKNSDGKIMFIPLFMDTFLPYLTEPEYMTAWPA